jgi:hypothetical protein
VTDSIQTPILQLKWAKYGVAGDYDKILLAWYGLHSFTFGIAYFLKGWYLPIDPHMGHSGLDFVEPAVRAVTKTRDEHTVCVEWMKCYYLENCILYL